MILLYLTDGTQHWRSHTTARSFKVYPFLFVVDFVDNSKDINICLIVSTLDYLQMMDVSSIEAPQAELSLDLPSMLVLVEFVDNSKREQYLLDNLHS